MRSSQLYAAVAQATGQSVREIRRLGFGLARPEELLDDEPDDNLPRCVDWDELEARRIRLFP